ncbi:cob(I)yrinic acid a,c-diamide adenosyltransferase [Acidobacteriota bacterium]
MSSTESKAFRGYIQVYTGNGKGKTTAALGQALRAAGRGLNTYIGQFLKGQEYGELEAARKLSPHITIEQFGRKGFIHVTKDPDELDIKMAREGLEKCRSALRSQKYDLVILDEINVALYFKVLTEGDVLGLLDQKPDSVELILTGRHAPDFLIQRADLVTEMKEVKHYYAQGIKARDGIER